MGDSWQRVVGARIAAEGKAIHPRDGAFAADLRSVGLVARFDTDGLRIHNEEAVALSPRTVAWGRESAADQPLAAPSWAGEPELGACTTAVDAQGACIRRLEYAGEGYTEWWIGLGTGLEQGWTLDTAPAGEGALVIEVAVDGALSIDREGEGAAIVDGQGRAWTVAGLNAWDALGAPLPIRVEVDGALMRFEVDDKDAEYPIDIDPVYETADWTATGATPTGSFADVVAGAGDVNNDGYDDVIIGGCEYNLDTGRAYVYHGSSAGLSTTATTTLTGTSINSLFGWEASRAGDVNNDGYDDLIVGAPSDYPSSGEVFIFHGSSSGTLSSAAAVYSATEDVEGLGYALSAAGDVNNDGYDDVIIGASPWSMTSPSKAFIYHGSATGLPGEASTTLAEATGVRFGSAVSGAGDVNNDGYDDVIVGDPAYNSSDGRASIFHGGSSGVSATATTTLDGDGTAHDVFGASVSNAGDVNADGYQDVIIGAYAYNSYEGKAAVYHGSSTGILATASAVLYEGSTTYTFGRSVSGAGDVNGDGYYDLIVGAVGLSTDSGRAFVYMGSASGVSTIASTNLTVEGVGDNFGGTVSGAGDINRDGYDDVLVGATAYHTELGRAYIYLGAPDGVPGIATTTLTGTAIEGDCLGNSVSGAGDVNNDGYDDVVIAEHCYYGGGDRVYIYHGSRLGLSADASLVLTGEATGGGEFGFVVSEAGDVNHDGYGDVLVAAPKYGSDAMGRVYVYYGSSEGLSADRVTVVAGAVSYAQFGSAISSAGDVNNDTYDDLIVGTYPLDAWYGNAYIYHGTMYGISTVPATKFDGSGDWDEFGSNVSGAGDVNHDGYDDVVVGAARHSSRNGYVGRVYVYHGSSTGVPTTEVTTLSGDPDADGVGIYNAFGGDLSGAGDVDNDGYDDLIVGSYGYDNDTGRAYVFSGSSTGLSGSPTTTLSGTSDHSYFGLSVSGAGDVNHDGYDDVIVGAQGSGGRVTVYHGTPTGIDPTEVVAIEGETPYDAFGHSVSWAGDVDCDCFDDVLVGAYEYEGLAGRAYLFRGYSDVDDVDLSDCVGADTGSPDTAGGEPTDGEGSEEEKPSGKGVGCGCASGGPRRSALWTVGLLISLLALRRRGRSP